LTLLGAAVAAISLAAGGCPQSPPNDDLGDLSPQAQAPATANPKEAVTLSVQLGGDVDPESVAYNWFQVYGWKVDLDDADKAVAKFVAPSLPRDQTLSFRVDVIGPDGEICGYDTVQVAVSEDEDFVLDGGFEEVATFEDQALEEGAEELAKSASKLAQEFADLVENGEDAAGNPLQETASGLQYVVVTEGTGDKPTTDDSVRVHYSGWLFDDGTSFDSSIDRGEPSTFGVTQVIDGWTEGLQLMPVGSHYRLVIPPDLAYGDQDKASIPPNSTLVFDVYLLRIE
jgi:FKBP-type peptidyl-prolyl cis-trans isomerase